MNATERAKAQALARLRLPSFAYGVQVINNLRWRANHNPDAPLSPVEKYLLDLTCWHYRNKLGGVVDFELPDEPPQRIRYLPPAPTHPQASLL